MVRNVHRSCARYNRVNVRNIERRQTQTKRPVRLLERKSLFKRKEPGTGRSVQLIAANVDTLLIVSSCNQDFNPARLERYLALSGAIWRYLALSGARAPRPKFSRSWC